MATPGQDIVFRERRKKSRRKVRKQSMSQGMEPPIIEIHPAPISAERYIAEVGKS